MNTMLIPRSTGRFESNSPDRRRFPFHRLAGRFVLLAVGILLSSCFGPPMKEITARNNGAKFWIYGAYGINNSWYYQGPVDSENRAHGYGQYEDRYAPQYPWRGTGKFVHGRPDGDHPFEVSLVSGVHHYSNGQHVGVTKTRDEVPAHVLNSLTLGAASFVAAKNGGGAGPVLAAAGTSSTNVTANYPEGFSYNVTTYVGQYVTDKYSFGTFYGITTYQTAKQNLEAGRSVYGGEDKSDRPGWFWIEKVPVRQGVAVKTGFQGIR